MKKLKEPKGNIAMSKVRTIIKQNELGISISQIARSCDVSRNTVSEYLSRAKSKGLSYEKIKDISDSELLKLLDIKKSGRRFLNVELNYEKINQELLRKNVTKQLLWEEHLNKNPEGFYSYSQFCSNISDWNKKQQISMHKEYKAGEELQIDYAGAVIPIYCYFTKEVLFNAQIFVSCLAASKYSFIYATKDQTTDSWILSLQKSFEFYGGTPKSINCDNPKSLIKKADFNEPEIQEKFNFFANYYDIAIIPSRIRKPKDKSLVENTVGNVQRQILARIRDFKFYSIQDLNKKLSELNIEFCHKTMKQYGKSRFELFNEIEKQELKTLPNIPYKNTDFKQTRVHIDYHVAVINKYYSVPHQYKQKLVWIRLTDTVVEIFYDNKLIAKHLRQDFNKKTYITNPEHMPDNHKFMNDWSPKRFIKWGASIGKETQRQIQAILSQRQFPQQAYRNCLGVLGLAKKYNKEKLELACKIANKHNCFGTKHVLLILKNYQFKLEQQLEINIYHENIRGDFH